MFVDIWSRLRVKMTEFQQFRFITFNEEYTRGALEELYYSLNFTINSELTSKASITIR